MPTCLAEGGLRIQWSHQTYSGSAELWSRPMLTALKMSKNRLRSREGVGEVYPHQYDRAMGLGSDHTSQDSLHDPDLDPAGLATPIPASEHRSRISDLSGTPGVGQVPGASASFQAVLRARARERERERERLQSPAACASEGVKRGFVDLPLLPQNSNKTQQNTTTTTTTTTTTGNSKTSPNMTTPAQAPVLDPAICS